MIGARTFGRTSRRAALLLGLALSANGCGAGGWSNGTSTPGANGAGSGGATGSAGSVGTTGGGGSTEPGGIDTQPGTMGSAGSMGTGGLPGAGGSPSAAGGSTGSATGGSGGSFGSAGAVGAAGGPGPISPPPVGVCAVVYTRLIPDPQCSTPPCRYVETSSLDLQSGAASVLRLRATMPGYNGVPRWDWIIMKPDGSDLPYSHVDATNATIEIKTESTGSYTFQPILVEGPACVLGQFPIDVAPPPRPSFVFRATPPISSGLPTRELVVDAQSVEASTHSLDLGSANGRNLMSLSPVDPRRFPLPSYVRVTSPAMSFGIEAYTGQGPLVANLAPELTYDVLVVPDGPWAPMLVSGPLDLLRNVNALVVSPGIPVTGEARDGKGAPIAGVRILLRQGARPSTLGVTAADGKFSLLTRDGALGAVISPPPGLGLPEAHVAAKSGIALLPGTASLNLRMQWAALPTGTLDVSVRGPNGGAVAGARVRAETSDEMPAVGTLHVGLAGMPDVSLGATGSARADGVTDASGVAHLGLLPAGAYRVTVAPPEGASLAVTSADVVLPAKALSTKVDLGPLVTLAGTLKGDDAPAGWRISAVDLGTLAPATMPEIAVGSDGRYALQVSPGRPYELVVETVTDKRARSFVLSTGATGPSTTLDGLVPGALTWRGTVVGGDGVVAGTLVEVFCVSASSPSCLDPSRPVAQGVSQVDGSLTLSLPNLSSP
jgi:hypothetical protein